PQFLLVALAAQFGDFELQIEVPQHCHRLPFADWCPDPRSLFDCPTDRHIDAPRILRFEDHWRDNPMWERNERDPEQNERQDEAAGDGATGIHLTAPVSEL